MTKQASLHDRLIAKAAQEGWNTTGWKAGILSRLRDPSWAGDYAGEVEDEEEIGDIFTCVECIPDGWRLAVEGHERGWLHPVLAVEFLEVELTNRISDSKWAEYTALWFALDGTEYFHFRLYGMDQFGRTRVLLDEDSSLDVLSYLYGADGVYRQRAENEPPAGKPDRRC